MRNPYNLLLVLFLFPVFVRANDYDKAWEALGHNDRAQAEVYLKKAMADPQTAEDAYITYIYLKTFEGKDDGVSDFKKQLYDKYDNADPYVYALWFNGACLGAYGRKTEDHQLELLAQILKNKKSNGSIVSAAHYMMALHQQFSAHFKEAAGEFSQIGAIEEWQFTGPFENLSGSGFDKTYGPVQHAKPDAVFQSERGADIGWFNPAVLDHDGWSTPSWFIPFSTAISYAQCFVEAPEDMKVLLNAGAGGAFKIWVNDQLVLSEEKERTTELDFFKNYVQLKKGYNRILVQLGYVSNSYPNFIVRLTDDQYQPLGQLKATATYHDYPDQHAMKPVGPSIPHFAVHYFKDKITQQPDNLINYILLCETYMRNEMLLEAREVIEEAVKKSPDNSLLRFELMQCLSKEGNRTLLSQELESIKEKDPDCLLAYRLNINRLMDEEKYEEAMTELEKQVKLFGEDADAMTKRIRLLGEQNRIDELVKTLQEAYKKYPDNKSIVQIMYLMTKNAYKDVKGALKIYEDYKSRNYSYDLYKDLADEYFEQGMTKKGEDILENIYKWFPYDPGSAGAISSYYFSRRDYKKALEYSQIALKQAPYAPSRWEDVAIIYEQLGDKEKAIDAYKKALYYDPTRFDSREKIRLLSGKEEILKAFPQTDVYELVKQPFKDTSREYSFRYLLDEKFTVIYPEGACEEFVTQAMRITNEKGIDYWKESYIPYNYNSQTLIIEKAEAIKPNGTKTPAEKNDNELVFTGLSIGDAIVIKYRVKHYQRGRFARDYWDKYVFNAFVPVDRTRYCMLVANNKKINYKFTNADLKPTVSDFEDFKLYTWQLDTPAIYEEEPLMPPLQDVGQVLHISTVSSWEDIAAWYSDIVSLSMKEEYELTKLYKELFPDAKKSTELQKAQVIYKYIADNIRYSSVSFRQGAYIPQKPSVTINTRLGDCKDISTLFVALAKMAGLKANLVLVDTRDNGQQDMILPSVEFNHCITRLYADGKEYYLELTDHNLPFGSLPSNLYQALSLVIPYGKEPATGARLQPIPPANRTPDRVTRKVRIAVEGTDLEIETDLRKSGGLTSGMRDTYASLTPQKQMEELEHSIGRNNSNPVKVEKLNFRGLDKLNDSIGCTYSYKVSNEVVEVGNMQMFKVPFPDVIATIDNFSKEKRAFPIEYWYYENTDQYDATIEIAAPGGKDFVEVPESQEFTFQKNHYLLKFEKKGPGKLVITRQASLCRDNILPKDYAEFLEFFNKIVKAESKYIAFK